MTDRNQEPTDRKVQNKISQLGDPNVPFHALPLRDKELLFEAEREGKTIEYWDSICEVWVEDVALNPGLGGHHSLAYRIKPEAPTLWRDMTAEEKGALLLAHHEGARLHVWHPIEGVWREPRWELLFQDDKAYRIAPAATREPIKIQGPRGEILGSGTMLQRDGEWDFDSIEVEEK